MQQPHPPHLLSWAGIDLAKATFEAALWGHEEFRTMRGRSFPRCEEGARALLAWLRESAGPGPGCASRGAPGCVPPFTWPPVPRSGSTRT